MAAATSFSAYLRNGAHHVLSCNNSLSLSSIRTFVGYLSSSSFISFGKNDKNKEDGRPKGVLSLAMVSPSSLYSHHHYEVGKAAVRRRARGNPPLFSSYRRYFRVSSSVSSEAETASSPTTIAEPTSSPPIPSSESSEPTIKDVAEELDIRVGRIIRAWKHPEADSLYVEEVDMGEEEPRTICSGLVKYIPLDHLQDAKVIVLANLKPRNMCGIKSNGMLLAASDAAHENVELLKAPEGSLPGERIWFGSEDENNQSSPATPNKVQKKKIWELVSPHMKTDGSCVAVLGVHPMRTSAGVVVCKSLCDGKIS